MTDSPTINRHAVVLVPTQACLDWINSCPSDKPMTLAEIQEEPTTFLLPESRGKSEHNVRRHFKAMFEQELESWDTDPDLWPKARSFKAFERFFTVQVSTMVHDIGKGMIITQDD